LGLLVALAVGVPASVLLTPAASALHLSPYVLTLIGKYLCYGMLALAVDLIWGYCGILSLGHAAFFSLGGYAMGMYLMRQIGTRGVYGDPVLPDFMVFLNWKSLPWFWLGFDHFWYAAVMIALVPGLLALVFGWLAFRSRVTGVYLSIITQALSYALMLAFFRNDMGFGGNNGFTDFKDLLGFSLQAPVTRVVLLVATAALLAASYVTCRLLVMSRAGRVIRAVRDAESRTRFLGYPVESYKLWVFVLSAAIAGIAGALYVRRWASSTPASSRRSTPSKWSSGSPWCDEGRSLARWPARFSSTMRRRTSRVRCPRSGSTRSARSLCSSRCSCLGGWSVSCRRGKKR
jgi:urea transport system permease protein